MQQGPSDTGMNSSGADAASSLIEVTKRVTRAVETSSKRKRMETGTGKVNGAQAYQIKVEARTTVTGAGGKLGGDSGKLGGDRQMRGS